MEVSRIHLYQGVDASPHQGNVSQLCGEGDDPPGRRGGEGGFVRIGISDGTLSGVVRRRRNSELILLRWRPR